MCSFSCGGGGYGPVWERDPERVLRDVQDEKLSNTRAREVYGVAINTETWSIDFAETDKLRATLKSRADAVG